MEPLTLATRLPGVCLGESLGRPDLGGARACARGLWNRRRPCTELPRQRRCDWPPRAWSNPRRAEAEPVCPAIRPGLLAAHAAVRRERCRFWVAEAGAPRVLCHGDLTLDNAMWHAGQVTGLLDFEYALMAPVQLDLNHLVKAAYGPADATQAPSPADRQGVGRLQETVAELARPLLAHPGEKAL